MAVMCVIMVKSVPMWVIGMGEVEVVVGVDGVDTGEEVLVDRRDENEVLVDGRDGEEDVGDSG